MNLLCPGKDRIGESNAKLHLENRKQPIKHYLYNDKMYYIFNQQVSRLAMLKLFLIFLVKCRKSKNFFVMTTNNTVA